MVWPPWLCLSAPASEKYCHSNHGCTVLLRTRRYVPPTPPHGTCWRTAGSLSGRHSGTGEMAGRSMIGPSDARPPSTPPYLGTPSCRAFRPPLSWVQERVQGCSAHCVANPTTRPSSVPWPRSSSLRYQCTTPSSDLWCRTIIRQLFGGPSGRCVARRQLSPSAPLGTGAPAHSPGRVHIGTSAAIAN